jgi:hypothetical protein
MDETRRQQLITESDGRIIRISTELDEIFQSLREKVSEVTWGASDDMSYYKLSKILARKIRAARIV